LTFGTCLESVAALSGHALRRRADGHRIGCMRGSWLLRDAGIPDWSSAGGGLGTGLVPSAVAERCALWTPADTCRCGLGPACDNAATRRRIRRGSRQWRILPSHARIVDGI